MNNEFLKMQKLAGLITEGEFKTRLNENIESFEDYISGIFDMNVPEDTEGLFTGVWEKSEYANPELYDNADEFIRLEQYLKSVGGKTTLEGNPDIMLKLLPNGDIEFSADLSLNEVNLNEQMTPSFPSEQAWKLWLKLSDENEIEDYDLNSFNHLQVGGFLKELQWIEDNKDKYSDEELSQNFSNYLDELY